jgi:hypothetical protein
METAHLAKLTPEQLAAITAGGGYAFCEDPKTKTIYHLIQQPESSTLEDQYVRQKIEEAYQEIDRNGFQELNMSAIKTELQRRLAARPGAK